MPLLFHKKISLKLHAGFSPVRDMPLRRGTQGGFSLVETLVAIAVLLVAVTAPLTIASKSIAQARGAANQVTAYYLAQEAIEYIMFKRDNNFINGASWTNGLASCMGGGACTIDAPLDQIQACGGGVCAPLRYNAATGLYGISVGAGYGSSIYTRTVQIDTVSAKEILIKVTMRWSQGMITRSFVLRDRMTNWYR